MKTKTKKPIKHFVIENTWLNGMDKGWGNGYVCVPKGHKAYGKNYDDVKVDAHGGLTFGSKSEELNDVTWKESIPEDCKKGYWVFGFDTAHFNDNIRNRPKAWVEKETLNLKKQFEKYVG